MHHVLESEGRCTIDGVSYELCAGDTLLIPGGAVHQTESTGEKPLRFLFSFPVDQMSDVAYDFAQNEREDNDAAFAHGSRPHRNRSRIEQPELSLGTGMLPEVGSDDPNAQPSI